MSEETPTLYDWAGGTEAFERLTEVFYSHVKEDEILEPVFRGMDPDHPKHVATWLAEVFGGPPGYTEEHGGYPHMLAKHRGLADRGTPAPALGQPDLRCRRRGRPA